MTRELLARNRQRRWKVDLSRVRDAARQLLDEELKLDSWELGIHLISARTMARLNQRWLQHEGSTDIITFDHREGPGAPLNGELFISVDDAARQAVEFRTSPELELIRYVVHGTLHLLGYDDLSPGPRRVMKREEDRLTRKLTRAMDLRGMIRPSGSRP